MHRLIQPVFFTGLMLAAAGVRRAGNPIITDVHTADPAAMAYDGTVYLYTGHGEAAEKAPTYRMNNWLGFSSTDMVNWTPRGSPLAATDFAWAGKGRGGSLCPAMPPNRDSWKIFGRVFPRGIR